MLVAAGRYEDHGSDPDGLLMDIKMPVMNGSEATARLRGNLPATRIIITATNDTPAVRQACRDSGADGLIAKENLCKELPALLEQIFACKKSGI